MGHNMKPKTLVVKDKTAELLEYEFLHAQMRYHKYLYYRLSINEISDHDYDVIERDYNTIAKKNNWPGSWVDCRDVPEGE